MIIIMQRTLEYVVKLSNNPNLNPKVLERITKLWENVSPDNMRTLEDGTKYVKIEL